MDILRHLADERRLEPIKVERAQIASYIRSSFQDLKEARITFPVSDQAAYLFAYTAMMKIARALLFLKGYRPKGMGQHETVVEVAGAFLGAEFGSLTGRFGRMRQKRNKLIYDIGGLVSHHEAEEAFKTAEAYLAKVRAFMEAQDPQLRLDLNT